MKKALSAYGVAWVIAMADKYGIERGKLLKLFTDLAPIEEMIEDISVKSKDEFYKGFKQVTLFGESAYMVTGDEIKNVELQEDESKL